MDEILHGEASYSSTVQALREDAVTLLPSQGPVARRRSRRYQGATWSPKESSALHGSGAWCRWCNKRHGYVKSLLLRYEKRKIEGIQRFVLMWACPKTGYVVEETVLGNESQNNG